jgi:hypothetical protein
MPDNSGWMGDPNDIKGRLQFEQSKKGLNPEKAAKEAAAKDKLAKAKAAAAQKAAMLKKASKMKPKFVIPASKFH